jgi:O-antigen/teichoic acid export membrane protein
MSSLVQRIRQFLLEFNSQGGERSAKARRNVFWMLFIKGGSMLAGLMLVPITLDYVDNETYGIWLALSSMTAWFAFFDIGLNQGLRNRLAEALAHDDLDLGKKYVSTTYALLTLIFIPLMVVLLLVTPLIDWGRLLNIEVGDPSGFVSAVAIVIGYFCLNFILSTINVVLLADQRPADAALRSFIQQVVSILIIFILTKTTQGSLIKLCIGLCAAPLLVVGLFNFTLFRGRYKDIAPRLKDIDFKTVPDLMKLGVQFFIIQIAAVIQYQLCNFLIIRHFGANDVTSYNIAYKYFSILTMIWGIVTAPLWSAVTDAVAKRDFTWIRSSVKKYLLMFGLMTLIGPLMLLVSQPVYHIWIGDKASISFALSFWIMLYNLVYMFGTIFVDVLNGAGELKVQTIASLFSPLVFLSLTHLLIRRGLGVPAILVASIVSNFNGYLLAPLQYRHLLKKKQLVDESPLDS